MERFDALWTRFLALFEVTHKGMALRDAGIDEEMVRLGGEADVLFLIELCETMLATKELL